MLFPAAAALLCGVLAASGPARPYDGPAGVPSDPASGEPDVAAPMRGEDPAPQGSSSPPATEGDAADPGEIEPIDEDPAPPSLGPRHRLIYTNLTAARYNPLGLVNEFKVGWRYQLINKPGALYKDSYIAAYVHTFLNPAFGRVGPMIEISPLTIINVGAIYNYVGYFTTFDQLLSFPSPTVNYDDDELADLGNDGQGLNYAGHGHYVTLFALLQAKVWKIALREQPKFYYASFDLRGDGRVYYDQTLDILHPNDGWVFTNDLDLIYLFDFGLKLGARYTATHAFYQEKHFFPGEPVTRGVNSPTHRIGPAALYTFYAKPERRFNEPTILLLVQWWARHRWRTGEDVHPGVPYLVLAFLFKGNLLPDPRPPGKRKKKRRR